MDLEQEIVGILHKKHGEIVNRLIDRIADRTGKEEKEQQLLSRFSILQSYLMILNENWNVEKLFLDDSGEFIELFFDGSGEFGEIIFVSDLDDRVSRLENQVDYLEQQVIKSLQSPENECYRETFLDVIKRFGTRS